MWFVTYLPAAAIGSEVRSCPELVALRLSYSVIQKHGLNFVYLYFLNYKWYVNDLYNI